MLVELRFLVVGTDEGHKPVTEDSFAGEPHLKIHQLMAMSRPVSELDCEPF